MFTNNQSAELQVVAPHIKKKLNLRRNLLKILKQSPNEDLKKRIMNLNREIKNHFTEQRKKQVRRSLVPGNSKSLWKAVASSKNVNYESIPKEMYYGGISVDTNELH